MIEDAQKTQHNGREMLCHTMQARQFPRCERCGAAIITSTVGRNGEKMATCRCMKIVGVTERDTPPYWGGVLSGPVDADTAQEEWPIEQ